MIGLSPRGAIDAIIVFPLMLAIGLALDLLGLVSIVGGTVLDLVGLLTIGLWVILRSGGRGKAESKQAQAPAKEGTAAAAKEGTGMAAKEGAGVAAKEGAGVAAKSATKTASKGASRLFKVVLRVLGITAVEFIPGVNAIFFGWTLLVVWELVSDLKNFSLEAGE